MAVFKSKKTYIKRYASKGSDKKITFSPSVKSSFNSVSAPKANGTKPSTPVRKPSDDVQSSFNPRFADEGVQTERIYNIGNSPKIEKKESIEKAHGTVITGAGVPRPEPIDKPDLSGVKAEANVRPVADPNEPIRPAEREPLAAKSEKTVSEYHFYDTAKAQNESAEKTEKAEIKTPEKAEKPEKTENIEKVEKVEKVEKIEKTEPIKQNPIKSEKVEKIEKPQANEKAKTAEVTKKAEKAQKPKRAKSSSSSAKSVGKAIFTAVKVALLVAIIGGCGFYGYRFYTEQIAQKQALDKALAINYAPEDYTLPETPQTVADANAQARDAAYKEAMRNAYVPSRGEVPNLFKYDYVKTCYLTFDDGPSGAITQSILDTLKKYDVKATFFLVGKNAQSHPDLVKRMYNEGHSLGNHSYSHDYSYMYAGDPEFDEEMNRCKNTIDNILGTKYNNLLFRFPGGSFEVYKSFYIYNIQAEGYQYVDWTALTGDAETQNPDKDYIMNSLKKSTNDGTKEDIVVLMHDAGAKQITADTLPDVIEYLKSKNYVFKPIYNSNYNPQ